MLCSHRPPWQSLWQSVVLSEGWPNSNVNSVTVNLAQSTTANSPGHQALAALATVRPPGTVWSGHCRLQSAQSLTVCSLDAAHTTTPTSHSNVSLHGLPTVWIQNAAPLASTSAKSPIVWSPEQCMAQNTASTSLSCKQSASVSDQSQECWMLDVECWVIDAGCCCAIVVGLSQSQFYL